MATFFTENSIRFDAVQSLNQSFGAGDFPSQVLDQLGSVGHTKMGLRSLRWRELAKNLVHLVKSVVVSTQLEGMKLFRRGGDWRRIRINVVAWRGLLGLGSWHRGHLMLGNKVVTKATR